jgi:UDP-2,3-diacylglucosamine pyrophosphatase LpxH
MSADKTYSTVYSISDLHLGGSLPLELKGRSCPVHGDRCDYAADPDRRYQMMSEGAALGDFLRFVGKEADEGKKPTALVINGDVVDFLAQAPHTQFSPRSGPKKLAEIAVSGSFRPVFEGLRAALQSPHLDVFIAVGNHDIELALDPTWGKLVELLGGADGVANRLKRVHAGGALRLVVGDGDNAKTVCFVHGNATDDWNAVDYKQLSRLNASLVKEKKPLPDMPICGGTRIVVDVLAATKTGLPFLDVVPLTTQALIAGLLLCSERSKDVPLSGAVKAVAARARSARWTDEDGPDGTVHLLDAGAPSLEAMRTEEELLNWLSMNPEIEPAGEAELLVADLVTSPWLRIALRSMRKSKSGFGGAAADLDVRYLSEEDQNIIASFADEADKACDILIAGHTHKARSVTLPSGQRYLNTGTWADLAPVQAADLSDDGFDRLIEDWRQPCRMALAARKRLRRTVARIDAAGARLLVWRASGGLGPHPLSMDDLERGVLS